MKLSILLKESNLIFTNITFDKNNSFKLACIIGFYYEKIKNNNDIINNYIDNCDLDFSMLTFPINIYGKIKIINENNIIKTIIIDDMSIFEKKNNININIYTYNKNTIEIIRKSKLKNDKIINLLLTNNNDKYFYYIINIKLLHEYLENKENECICHNCSNKKESIEKLKLHLLDCELFPKEKIIMPKHGSKNSFNSFSKKINKLFVAYVDFECYTKNVENNDKHIYQVHEPNSWFFYLTCTDKSLNLNDFQKLYIGENAVKNLIEHLNFIKTKLFKLINININQKDIIITSIQKKTHYLKKKCYICNNFLKNKQKDYSVNDKTYIGNI